MRLFRSVFLCVACLILVGGRIARAQQQDSSAPAAPASQRPLSGTAMASNTDADQNSDQAVRANRPLSGVQNLTLGVESGRSYWQPHFDVFGTADSNPRQNGQRRNWITWTSASAGVDIHKISGISDLTLGYTSGGMYSNQNNVSNGIVQGLNFADKLTFRRSSVSFFGQASYLPESPFGFAGLGTGLPENGFNLPGLAFNPGQTVLTGRGKMLTNSDAIELEKFLTRRSSLTFSGGYSLLHHFGSNSDLFNYGIVNVRGGYNHQLTEKDTVAVIYTFGDFRYTGSSQSVVDHTLQLSYGRLISDKLALQIAVGPDVYSSQTAAGILAGGSNTSGGTTAPTQRRVQWSLNSSLQYQERRYGLALSYDHGVNGGAGVLTGALANTVTGSLTRQMSRTFSSGLSGGYSRNHGLPDTGAFANQVYDYWFGGVNLTEPLGSTLGLTLSYQVQYQTSNNAACVGPTCGANVLRHMISVGLGWHERPLLF